MKKLRHLLTVLLLLCSVVANAYVSDFEVDGIYYSITISIDNTVEVTCSDFKESVVIPESVTYNGVTYRVTGIGYNAFQDCSGLTSITIPNSVTYIGSYAFYGCSGLTSITIPNSVTSIESSAFQDCSGLTSVEFNATNCTSIGHSNYPAFEGCTSLSIVTIGENVKNIPAYAFYECSGLTSVTIGNSVTSIGNSAFYGCYKLTSVTIGNSVTSIGESAFYNCDALTSVEIPNSVTSIGNSAFNDCSRLTSITIPNSVTSIGDAAFRGCEGLTSITIGNGVTSIGDYAFLFCTGLTSITIPNSVTSIGYEAFYKCSGLTSVTIGNSVTSIGGYAFLDCYRLKTVYNSSSLTFTKGSTGYGYIAYYAYEIILPKTYALTFVVDGEVFRTDSIEYGDEIVFPEMEEREGCTFSGWKRVVDKISIDIAADADRMLYSNAPCTNTTYNDQFVSWDVLFDNNAKTIFHSEYGNKQTVDGLDHYIRVDMGEGNSVGSFEFTYMTREGNDRVSPKTIVVEGSNEAFGEYTEIATLTNLPGAASTTYNSDILGDDNIKYRYIRYRVTETSAGDMDNGHPFFAISEFGMSRVYNDVPTTMPDFGFTLEGSYIPNAISSISELKNNVIYHVSQPHHSSGKTAWAIIPEISDEIIANDWFVNVSLYDECQQFAFISNDNGKTHYLYHPAEKVFVNKDGSLSETPVDAISFKDGAYENTFVVYFDNEHYININAEITLDINGWNTPDGGNSCLLVPVGTFDPTDALRAIDNATAIEDVECEETETVIYDLQGRRIKEITASGIYVINGKKTIVR